MNAWIPENRVNREVNRVRLDDFPLHSRAFRVNPGLTVPGTDRATRQKLICSSASGFQISRSRKASLASLCLAIRAGLIGPWRRGVKTR